MASRAVMVNQITLDGVDTTPFLINSVKDAIRHRLQKHVDYNLQGDVGMGLNHLKGSLETRISWIEQIASAYDRSTAAAGLIAELVKLRNRRSCADINPKTEQVFHFMARLLDLYLYLEPLAEAVVESRQEGLRALLIGEFLKNNLATWNSKSIYFGARSDVTDDLRIAIIGGKLDNHRDVVLPSNMHLGGVTREKEELPEGWGSGIDVYLIEDETLYHALRRHTRFNITVYVGAVGEHTRLIVDDTAASIAIMLQLHTDEPNISTDLGRLMGDEFSRAIVLFLEEIGLDRYGFGPKLLSVVNTYLRRLSTLLEVDESALQQPVREPSSRKPKA